MLDINERTSYTIQEAADQCYITRYDVQDFALQSRIKTHVWIPLTMIEESHEVTIDNRILTETKERNFEGYIPLYASDIRKLLKYQEVNIRYFPGEDPGTKIHLKPGTPDVEVFKKDIVILKDDLKQLQDYLGVNVKKSTKGVKLGQFKKFMKDRNLALQDVANAAAPVQPLSLVTEKPASYDELYQSIYFKGEHYSFGGVQANIIKQLHEAAVKGHERVHFKLLIERSGAQSMYMRDVFKSKPNWQKLILSDKRGYYWLHEEFILTHTMHEDDHQ